MPKVLILVSDESDQSKFLGECAGEGARAVRFSEVDVRTPASREPSELRDYDGIVVVGSEVSPSLITLLEACESDAASEFGNTVFATAGFDGTAILERVARLGGIIVAERKNGLSPDARAKHTGRRVAKVVEWVRHALGHEHGHHHHAHSP